jgi:hypothetical protein
VRAGAAAATLALLAGPALAGPYRHPGVPEPSAEDLARVKPEWYLRREDTPLPCNAVFAGRADYAACLRVFLSEQPPLDAARREHFGERYDPAKYYACRIGKAKNVTGCEALLLRRRESVERWPHHEGKPVPIQWPPAPRESVYRPGMGPLEYWRALCKAEAGEFIARSVPDVTTIYQIRPRAKESEYAYRDRYVMEDPYGYIESESGTLDNVPGIFVGPGWTSANSPGSYRRFETPTLEDDIPPTRRKYFHESLFQPIPLGRPYQRFSGADRTTRQGLQLQYIALPESRYGWTWRGIRRPHDREVGVAAGGLAVVDLKTGEILGLRRGFILGALEAGKPVNWFHGNVCPEYHLMPGIGQVRQRNKDFDFSLWFINKVLVPVGSYRD